MGIVYRYPVHYQNRKYPKVSKFVDVRHATSTGNLYGCSAIDDAYQNLANAIVAKAVDDIVKYRVCKTLKLRYNRTSQKDYDEANRFLHDESRLSMYTSFTPADMDNIIEKKTRMVIANKLRNKEVAV